MAVATLERGPDILTRTAPPLSATSDAPLAPVARPPESASNSPTDHASGVPAEMSPVEQAAARAARSAEAGTDTEAGAEPGVEPAAKTPAKPDERTAEQKAADADNEVEIVVDGKKVETPPYVKREITKARNQQRAAQAIAVEAQAAAKAATEALAALQAEHAALKAKAEPPKPAEEPVVDARPARDKFDDPDAYDEATVAWATREGERKAAAKIEAETQAAKEAERVAAETATKTAQEAELARLHATWETKKAAAVEKYADYAEVAEGDHTVSHPMAHAILLAENGPDIAYHLGQNPEESARIAALPNIGMQIFEMGRLAARLATPPARVARPRPIEPIDTNTAPADTSAREESMEEYGARRTREIQSGRRPFMESEPRRARLN